MAYWREYSKENRSKITERVRTRRGVLNKDPNAKAAMRVARRRYHLKQYGISLEDFDIMLVSQNGVCAVCHKPETSIRRGEVKSLDVDHNHETGAIRGLLCSACNSSLGLLGEDPLRIRSLADYVEKN